MTFRFPKGVLPAPGLVAPGRGFGRFLAAGGGGSGIPGDVLSFTGPQVFNAVGIDVEDGTNQIAARPFTLTIDLEFTAVGTTQTIFNKWSSADNKRGLLLRHLAPNHLQVLYSTTGGNSLSLSFGAGAAANERMTIELQRAGDVWTLKKNDVTLDTDTVAVTIFESDAPMRLGAGLIGTIYSASFVFND